MVTFPESAKGNLNILIGPAGALQPATRPESDTYEAPTVCTRLQPRGRQGPGRDCVLGQAPRVAA